MPRASKSQAEPTPAGPRLVRKSTPKGAAEPASPVNITHEQIAWRAYELFVQDGLAHGHHLDHWLRAERELMGELAVRTAAPVARTRARR
jgi:DUF2934 family protein